MAARARIEVVPDTLWLEPESEVERLMVSGALVIRTGEHYRIAMGEESAEELETLARRREGTCDCGNPLSARGSVLRCRACGREFSLG